MGSIIQKQRDRGEIASFTARGKRLYKQGAKNTIKLTCNLKKQAEQTAGKEEAREPIKEAGMLLSDDSIEAVTGGVLESVSVGSSGPIVEPLD